MSSSRHNGTNRLASTRTTWLATLIAVRLARIPCLLATRISCPHRNCWMVGLRQRLLLRRATSQEMIRRFRHPKSTPFKGVTLNGPSTNSWQAKPWTAFDKDKETITLKGLPVTVAVTGKYCGGAS